MIIYPVTKPLSKKAVFYVAVCYHDYNNACTPFEDDNPKYAENTVFRAGTDI